MIGEPESREFNLRALVRQIRDEFSTGDKHVIAKETARRIGPEDRDAAYMQALIEVARVVVKDGHPQLRSIPAPRSQEDELPLPAVKGAGQRNSGRSSKVAAIRRTWPQLKATYACLDENKQLGDYGRDDLIFVADYLDKQARQSGRKASQYRRLSQQMALHGVTRVRDLPDSVLTAAFVGEEAA